MLENYAVREKRLLIDAMAMISFIAERCLLLYIAKKKVDQESPAYCLGEFNRIQISTKCVPKYKHNRAYSLVKCKELQKSTKRYFKPMHQYFRESQSEAKASVHILR
jgi:hypothetical protein